MDAAVASPREYSVASSKRFNGVNVIKYSIYLYQSREGDMPSEHTGAAATLDFFASRIACTFEVIILQYFNLTV